ncbi:MAG: hypothetical protein COA96_02090 [SAR86 cluster bacterium]|uniref:Yip1 domain-containing protein n=1 Tax=SAR86 cluster bacterium TaxID=2030880 RepID=A0A2A5BAE4_9GAMM|nr:MAG: hypothetical protein COA96_02090 [SAR86 cluster bacterium]
MTETEPLQPANTEPAGLVSTAINILTSPDEAFNEIRQRPKKLFPLALIMISTMAAMFWYFTIIDFDWYIDDTLAIANIPDDQLETARENMLSMSQNTFRMFGVLGGTIGILIISVLQAGYLSMVSALSGDKYKFTHWFSLVAWTGLPSLLAVIGMVVTILLSPNGQLSAYALNPFTLANLGVQSDNASLQTMLNSVNLIMFWSMSLTVMGHRQWLQCSLLKSLTVVLAPYALIFGVWTYIALT